MMAGFDFAYTHRIHKRMAAHIYLLLLLVYCFPTRDIYPNQ